MKNFLFGAASSAHQVEGNNKHSDWWEFEQRVLSKIGISSGLATDHYNRYEDDFTLAKQLGHNAHRLSIEWARIEPAQGKIDYNALEHYRTVLRTLKRMNITPIVTLWHFSTPLWFNEIGGFCDKHKNIEHFIDYAKFVVSELKEDLEYIITMNEPIVYAYNGYLTGDWPPQKKSFATYMRLISILADSHNKLYKELKTINPKFKISIAKNNQIFEAVRKDKIADNLLQKYFHHSWNHKFLNKVKHNLDFIGLNYYFYRSVRFDKTLIRNFYQYPYPTPRRTDMNWEVYPKGIYLTVKDLHKKYKLPIIVTENGVADDKDKLRQSVLKETLEWLFKAKDEGVDIQGYLHWALTDNFEWDKGFKPRFGLIKIDYNNLSRTIRPSALLYKDLIEKYTKKMENQKKAPFKKD